MVAKLPGCGILNSGGIQPLKSNSYKYKIALFFSLMSFLILLIFKIIPLPLAYLPESCLFDFIMHKKQRIALVAPYNGIAERQVYRYLSCALKELGYCPICVYGAATIRTLSSLMDIDVCINSSQGIICPKSSYNFLIAHYEMKEIRRKYDAILSVLSKEKLKKLFPNEVVVPFYFSVPSTKFSDNLKTRLFFGGDAWDKYRKSTVAKLYKFLDRTGYFDLYGTKGFDLTSYRGFIPFGESTVLNAMRRSGVALVLHSNVHFENDIPTARIFEAVAASTVVITDRLPFIVKNFGNTVLYIDRDRSPEEIFKQIDKHMQWILSHPEESIELARRSHEIFIKNFTLERIMKNVMKNYENSKNKQIDSSR